MSLETPNRFAASIVFFYALEGALEPGGDNPEIVVITAANGVNALQALPGLGTTIQNGFFLDLQEKIRPETGTFFINGMELEDLSSKTGFTPCSELTGLDAFDELCESQGNFLAEWNDMIPDFGFFTASMWDVPPTNQALPIDLPVPVGS